MKQRNDLVLAAHNQEIVKEAHSESSFRRTFQLVVLSEQLEKYQELETINEKLKKRLTTLTAENECHDIHV